MVFRQAAVATKREEGRKGGWRENWSGRRDHDHIEREHRQPAEAARQVGQATGRAQPAEWQCSQEEKSDAASCKDQTDPSQSARTKHRVARPGPANTMRCDGPTRSCLTAAVQSEAHCIASHCISASQWSKKSCVPPGCWLVIPKPWGVKKG
jgi:hypothetical protein